MPSVFRMGPVDILIVEDNTADVRLVHEAFKAARVINRLHAVANGKEALDFLHRRDAHQRAPRPDVILLDLNLPGIDGHEVLRQLKASPTLRSIPVIIFTSSGANSDVVQAYEEHANCFISKPTDFAGLMHVVEAVEDFWFTTVKLPGTA